MKLSHVLKCSALGGLLLCSLGSSWALTLGRVHGAVILGQPLEVTVPLQVAAGEDFSRLCFQADVAYGELRQDPARVSVTTETQRPDGLARVRVVVYTRVNEPVVTLDLRSGCGFKTMRHYVLLADLASEVTPPVALAQPTPRPVVPLHTIPAAPAEGTPSLRKAARPLADTRVMDAKTLLPRKVRPPESARLKLALLDGPQGQETELRMSQELVLAADEDLKKREASAVLWRALNTTPEDSLRDAARVAAVESQLQLLRGQSATNQQLLVEMSVRLDKARSQRYANPLIYGLLVLLMACGGGLAYGWRLRRSESLGASPWWRAQAEQGEADIRTFERVDHSHGMPQAMPSTSALPTPPTSDVRTGLTEVDIELHLAESAQNSAVALGQHDVVQGLDASQHEISSQEIRDVRQQADFFMTLGQHAEGIAVLERCINDSAQASPWVYLDLLGILHTLGRKADYERHRVEFNRHFKGRVPEFADFNQDSSDLEDYPEVCARIQALWPNREALNYIQSCLVRTTGDDAAEGLGLNAYRDLLLLHSVARHMAQADTGIDLDLT